MKDFSVLGVSLVLIGSIGWFFLGKKSGQEKNEEITGELETIQLNISGMHCAGCAAGIEATLKIINGIKEASVNFATSKGIFTYDPTKISKDKIIEKIKELGYDANFDLENFEKKR